MLSLSKMDRDNPELTQLEFARLATFGFNKNLISLAMKHLDDRDNEKFLLDIVEYKWLLVNKKESILEFFNKISNVGTIEMSRDSINPYINNGISMIYAKSFLTSKIEYVSLNEYDYCIRRGEWYIECINPNFKDFINSDLTAKVIAVSSRFPLECIDKKSDIVNFDGKLITLKNGDVYSCQVF